MNTLENPDATAAEMARAIRDVAKAMTSRAFGDDTETVQGRLVDAIGHIRTALDSINQDRDEKETTDPATGIVATVDERTAMTFPDDAPDGDERETGITDADDITKTEDTPESTEERTTDTEDAPLPDNLEAASKRIYQAAKFINRAIDNRRDINPNDDEIADITYRLADWLQGLESNNDPRTARSKAARHLRHIVRFIAKSRRRKDFHHVRRVRKFHG